MLTTPQAYARQLLDLFFDDEAEALREVFEAAKVHAKVPNIFWRDVFLAIQAEAAERRQPRWETVAPHVYEYALKYGYSVRASGTFPSEVWEVCATPAQITAMYDHFTP